MLHIYKKDYYTFRLLKGKEIKLVIMTILLNQLKSMQHRIVYEAQTCLSKPPRVMPSNAKAL